MSVSFPLANILLSALLFFPNGCLRWHEHQELQFYSERVKILFCAIYTTVNQLGEMASAVQNRDVRKHLIELVSFMCDPLMLNCIVLTIVC